MGDAAPASQPLYGGRRGLPPKETTPLLQHQDGAASGTNSGGPKFGALRLNESCLEIPAVERVADDFAALHHGVAGGTVESAMFNLSNTVIGAGIMGLPGTLKVLGIPVGLVTMVLVGLLSEYSLQRLLRCTTAAKAWSFGDLMAAAFGRNGRRLLRGCIIIHNIGILVVFLIIIGDVLSGSGKGDEHNMGLFEEWAGGPTWWNSRPAVLIGSMLTVIGPLVMLPHIDSLQFTSGLSILLAVVFIVITIVVALVNIINGTINWGGLRWAPNLETSQDLWNLFSIIPTMATAFTCHYNLHPILVELEPPREERMAKAVRGTMTLCTSVYCVIALFGYMLFGEGTYADVLANFDHGLNIPGSEVLNDVVRLFYAFHLMLVFPVVHFSLRASTDAVLFKRAPPLAQSPWRLFCVSTALVSTITLLSIVIPNIQFAFQFVGSAGAATLALTFPGMIALSPIAGADSVSRSETFMAWFMLILGLGVTATGLTNNVHSLFSSN